MPAKEGAVDWESGIRTGPYMLGKFEPGVIATFNKNPNYFKSDKGWFDRVECLAINDVTARTNALNTGEIHYMDRCDLKTLDILKQNPNLVISETTGYGHYVYVMNVPEGALRQSRCAQCVQVLAQSRRDRREGVSRPRRRRQRQSDRADRQVRDRSAAKHIYDPDMVKSLLKKAGAENTRFDLSVADAAFAGATDSAFLWQEHARAAGLNLNVIREPNDGYWDNVWLKKPFFASYWVGRPTCDWMFTLPMLRKRCGTKRPGKIRALMSCSSLPARRPIDAKRAGMYAEMQQLVHDDGGLVNLVFNSYVDAHAKALAHGEVAANWPMDGGKIAERWWFA